jgi:tetratricopeptide (TPR) repeat protein
LALLPTGGLQAAETVLFNESAAHQCYLAALRGADAREVDICNAALQHQSLKSADFAATLSNRGLLLARSGRYEDALRDHDRAIQTTPDLASLYINRSNTYTRAQRFDEAMGDLDQAIEIAGRPQPAATPVPLSARTVGRQRPRPRAGGRRLASPPPCRFRIPRASWRWPTTIARCCTSVVGIWERPWRMPFALATMLPTVRAIANT